MSGPTNLSFVHKLLNQTPLIPRGAPFDMVGHSDTKELSIIEEGSPPNSTMAPTSISTSRLSGTEIMNASGFLGEEKAGEIGEKQLVIEEKLQIRTSAQDKMEGLKMLRHCISQIERQMNRSINREISSARAAGTGDTVVQPKLSVPSREMLIFACQVLQGLMGFDDKALILADKVEQWLPVAAGLFGRALGGLFRGLLDHNSSLPESIYAMTVTELSKHVQAESSRLLCASCVPGRPHAMNLVQLKLLAILKIHLAMWNNARAAAEEKVEDVVWPISVSLHTCQMKLRRAANKILSQAVRAHVNNQVKSARGIEVLTVTSYDAAIAGLAEMRGSPAGTVEVTYYLTTLASLWQDSTLSLRYKLTSVRKEYFDVRTAWEAAKGIIADVGLDHTIEKEFCAMLPLLAASDPEVFGEYALEEAIALLTPAKRPAQARYVQILGLIIKAVGTDALKVAQPMFRFLLANVKRGTQLDACYIAARDILLAFGPCATDFFSQLLAIAQSGSITYSKLMFVTQLPSVIPMLGSSVDQLMTHEVRRIIQIGPQVQHSDQWKALLRVIPTYAASSVGDLTDHATELLVQALCPESYIEIVEEALEQMRHPILACEENSSVLVNTILRLIEKRREPRLLEMCLAILSEPRLRFEMQAVTLPLLLQLGTSDIRTQRVVASLLTIQAARFPSLIVPILRKFVRATLLVIDSDSSKSSTTTIGLLATVCIVIPSLPLALSELYARPVIAILLELLRGFHAIGREASTIINSLASLAKHCSHVWETSDLKDTIAELRRLSEAPDSTGDSTLALSCLASLMTIPQSRDLQDTVVADIFSSFILQDQVQEAAVKCKVMAVIGAVGTADRNPIKGRDHNAALRREDGIYDARLRARIATAYIRDKRGAESPEYQVAIIADNLTSMSEARNFGGKISVWTTLLKLCLMVPDERYAEKLPNILEDIMRQYKENENSRIVRIHRPKLLVLISQAILLKPKGYNLIWPELYDRMCAMAEEDSLKSADVSGIQLVILSVISKNRSDIKSIARKLLPLLLRLLATPGLDTASIIFNLKLIAVFQSYTDSLVSAIAQKILDLEMSEAISEEILRLFAHLSDYISLFDATLPLEQILAKPEINGLISDEAMICRARIRGSMAFCPLVPQELTFTDYPDLRPYQDMQFANLALTESDKADQPFVEHVWSLGDTKEQSNWDLWARRLEHHVVNACRVDMLKVVSHLSPRTPRGVLHAAFISYYTILSDAEKAIVGRAIGNIVTCKDVPPYLREDLWLSILEFTRKSGRVQISSDILSAARRSLSSTDRRLTERADPILVWYAEMDAYDHLDDRSMSLLIESNLRVGVGSNIKQDDAAWSSMLLAQDHGVWLKSDWYEALGRWSEAIAASKSRRTNELQSIETLLTCHYSLTNFPEVLRLAEAYYPSLSQWQRAKLSNWCTVSAWTVGDYTAMGKFLSSQPKGSSRLLYKAILDTHHNKFEQATLHIAKAQASVYDELQARSGYHDFSARNYVSAIETLNKAQMLVELEEVIRYKQSNHRPELQKVLADTWQSRLKASHVDINMFHKRLLLWSLAAPPHKLQDGWIYLAKLAHERGLSASNRIMATLGQDDQPGDKVSYTRIRMDWDAARTSTQKLKVLGELEEHASILSAFCGFPTGSICFSPNQTFPQADFAKGGTRLHRRRLSRALARLGQWTQEYQSDWAQDPKERAFEYLRSSVLLDPGWSIAMEKLAEMALDIQQYKQSREPKNQLTEDMVQRYILPACYALFQGIHLQTGPEQAVKATLLAVTLWFRHGDHPEVLKAVKSYLQETPCATWLSAIPQLIARLGARDLSLRGSLIEFLLRLSSTFGDALIWPLLTASQTPRSVHQSSALTIMHQVGALPRYSKMVKQAQVVGKDLILSAITPTERWKNAIEKMLYVEGLSASSWLALSEEYNTLKSLQTEEEYLFYQRFGDALLSARSEVERYLAGAKSAFYKACSEYQVVYRKLYGLLDTWRKPNFQLNLRLIAPRIAAMEDSELTVPGQFDAKKYRHEQEFINRFEPMIDVLNTKQLPRKLTIHGKSSQWTFLLKGNEDLRQDERIMQLIVLTNSLLNHNNDAYTRQLFLQPYSVIPLSPNSGLCQWVPDTETLMALVTAGRTRAKGQRLIDRELAAIFGIDPKEMQKGGFDCDKAMAKHATLSLAEKVDRYRSALTVSSHTDLKDLLWRRSSSSQTWLSRRTCFARSIATTSMVGYVIGLGDRHPGNILIEQTKFNAISIDFGDVFEAAAERSAFAEHVPFRLTPEITNAFEFAATHGVKAPGSRGHFKTSSVITLSILRQHTDTLLAMLEAFALDPLLTWQAKEVENPAVEDTYEKKKEQLAPPTAPKSIEKKLEVERTRRERENEVIVNLGGSFIAAGSLAAPKPTAAGVRLDRIDEVDSRNSSLEVDMGRLNIQNKGKSRTGGRASLETVIESVQSGASTASNEESYTSKKLAHVMTNERAVKVLNRIEQKLAGNDMLGGKRGVKVEDQVQFLIEEATSHENLSQGYPLGWLPTW